MRPIPIPAGLVPELFRAELIVALPELGPRPSAPDAPGSELLHPIELGEGVVLVPNDFEAPALAVAARYANERLLRDRADAALGNLQAAWDGWATLTPAQKDAAIKLSVRCTIALIRLELRRLDST